MESGMGAPQLSPFMIPPPDFANPYGHFNASMAIIIVVLVSAFFIMGFFSVYVKRCSSSEYDSQIAHLRDPGRLAVVTRPEVGLDKSVYEAFPVVEYSEVKAFKTAKECTECVVCLSDFEDDERLRVIPKCGHFFHPECIDAWFQSHATCPLCRLSLSPSPETGSGRGGFWGSGRFSLRSSTANSPAAVDRAEGAEGASTREVVVTVRDQESIDLEQLRAFLRAGSVRGQSGRRGSFRREAGAEQPATAEPKGDEGEAKNQADGRPGEAELRKTLSRNASSFRQATRGLELELYLAAAGGASVSPQPSPHELSVSTENGSSSLRFLGMGLLGGSLRRSNSFGLLSSSTRHGRGTEAGGTSAFPDSPPFTHVESQQEYARDSVDMAAPPNPIPSTEVQHDAEVAEAPLAAKSVS